MKKQILFLAMFILALIFAGTNKVLGQTIPFDVNYMDAGVTPACTPALPLGCADDTDPLSPLPGVEYTYEISVSSAPQMVHWFVTDDPAVWGGGLPTTSIDPDGGGGAYILDAEDGVYNETTTPNTSTSVKITWRSFDGNANQVLLVAYAIDAAGCTDNIQAWRIIPQYSFTLDIAGLLDDGSLGDVECVSPVQGATYDGTNLTLDYGENWIYFTVNAANWQTSWKPTLSIDPNTTATTNSLVDEVMWAYPDEAVGSSAVWHTDADDVQASHYTGGSTGGTAQNGFIGSSGACIVLRVHVDHTDTGTSTQNESLASETVVVGINGEMWNPEANSGAGAYDGTYPDMDEDTAGACVSTITDEGSYNMSPRPTITEVAPAPASFVPKN